jgi:hypothetical protein
MTLNQEHDHEPVNFELEGMELLMRVIRIPLSMRMPTISASASPTVGITGQIVMFGMPGGVIPCPAVLTVLLLAL